MQPETTIAVAPRPKIWAWRRVRGITQAEAAEVLGVSTMQVQRYELVFGNGRRQVPGLDVMAKIVRWTNGEVSAEDFYPPELRRTDQDDAKGWMG